jgi:hypothetical protein
MKNDADSFTKANRLELNNHSYWKNWESSKHG